MTNKKELILIALESRNKSYSPYSSFAVGAALLSENGSIFTGCNIENASFSPTVCAERTAFLKAVSEGYQSFTSIAIVGGPKDEDRLDYCAPCGVCRQIMSEFCNDNFEIILARSENDYKIYTLNDLLPQRFGPKDLNF